MQRMKQASKTKRMAKTAVPALGAAGLTFSLAGGASASAVPTGDLQQRPSFAPGPVMTLSEEELADVSLATFHLIDNEDVSGRVLIARGCGGCRGCGCRGCAGCRGCRCGVGCAGCAGCAGCGGCGGWGGCGVDAFWFGNFSSACCASWGRCRLC
jgi:hypothetical protein